VSAHLVCVSCQPTRTARRAPHPAFLPPSTSSRITKITHLCETCDSALFFAGSGPPYFSLGCFLTNSLRSSGGAKNGDRFWQTFMLPYLFFRCNSKRKREFESPELSRFQDRRCVHIMQPIFGFCKQALFLDVHQVQELASCSAPHHCNCFSLHLSCFGKTENSCMNFRSVRTKDPRDPPLSSPARKSTDPRSKANPKPIT
jgi:hypothetical protein